MAAVARFVSLVVLDQRTPRTGIELRKDVRHFIVDVHGRQKGHAVSSRQAVEGALSYCRTEAKGGSPSNAQRPVRPSGPVPSMINTTCGLTVRSSTIGPDMDTSFEAS
jgi:hypothetical protein